MNTSALNWIINVRSMKRRERGMEPRPIRDRSRVEKESDCRRPSERKGEDGGSRGVNLPPLLATHLGRSENGQPLQLTLTFRYGGNQPLTNSGGISLPMEPMYPPNVPPTSYPFYAQLVNSLSNTPMYPNYGPTGLFTDSTDCVTPFVRHIKDYPLPDGLKMPSHLAICSPILSKILPGCGGTAKKQRDGESTRDFVTRYTDDTLQILRLHKEQRISGFVHGLKTRSLVELLSTDFPTTYKGLTEKTYTWIEAKEVATNVAPSDHKECFDRFNKSSSRNNNKGKKKNRDRLAFLASQRGSSGSHSRAPYTRMKTLNFVIVMSNSPHNLLLERTAMWKMGIVVSTIHIPIKFHTHHGIGTVVSTYESNKLEEGKKKIKETIPQATRNILSCVGAEKKIIINDKNIIVEGKHFNMEHKLNEYKHIDSIKQKKQGLALEQNEAPCKEVDKLTKAGILREVKYQMWEANPIMVRKSNEGWRMYVHFTCINKAFPKDCYPLLKIYWKVESLSRFRLKCLLDAYKGNHHIQMADGDKDKTTFFIDKGIFCYRKMPFGLKNTGATYRRLIEKHSRVAWTRRPYNRQLKQRKPSEKTSTHGSERWKVPGRSYRLLYEIGRSEVLSIHNRKTYGEVRMGEHRMQTRHIPVLYFDLSSLRKWTRRGYKRDIVNVTEQRLGKNHQGWVDKLPQVLWEFKAKKNDKRRREDLDILEERIIASIKEGHYKQRLERYYNKRVRPSTFKPGTYVFRLNSASKAEFQGNIGPTWEGTYIVRKA
uniref:Reverse transcriptase domain-containing protein n=1 Tax=Tanacetum cinerariifolium TaxID=118510 RepID=A0A6L2MFK6_TANCI|nr:reverse transcriptase domain-containing protein [Tanacetum cinerariifolium]